MALFGKKSEGGLMDVIRCDEPEYLVWKWRPAGAAPNTTSKENSIRWGSTLRVKDGEVAVFVYKQKDGVAQDFVEGPFDESIRTANFPVLTGIIGAAYAGQSPFQAEVYFINLAGNIRMPFGIPYFTVADHRFADFAVPVAARGSLVFNIKDYRQFIKLHRLIQFDLESFKTLVRDAVIRYVKSVISNASIDHGISVIQIERKVSEINDAVLPKVTNAFRDDFGVNLLRFDLETIEIDKDTPEFAELRSVTADLEVAMRKKQNEVNMRNLDDMQAINATNMSETLAINRNAAEEFQRLQTQTTFLPAHQINRHADVLQTAAESLGSMGRMDFGSGGSGNPPAGGGGFNPVGVMAGLALGGAMGNQMANMTNAAGQAFQQPQAAPPPLPAQYHAHIDGKPAGPFSPAQLHEMGRNGQVTRETQVWRTGMPAWAAAGSVGELQSIFAPEVPRLVRFHAVLAGQASGPFDGSQLTRMRDAGQLTPQTMVWSEGMPQWQAAGTVPDLGWLFTAPSGPPPVPPSAGMPPPPAGT